MIKLHAPKRCFTFFLYIQRYRFFFPRKRLGGTHSLDLGNFCFFFFPAQEKIASHSLTRETVDLQKKVKTGKKWHFLSNFGFFRCFFFPQKISQNSVFFFFPGKDYTSLTHSNFRAGKKKTAPEKKKQQFYSLTRFSPKKYKF